ncbi:MAG: hypothetical protein U0L18_02980 [Acutalibacteraceae bacterium]|nr:hypothetical protein [Acutalibacteraceae bacterium]
MTLNEYCKTKYCSRVTMELIEKLKVFSSEDDYIIGVLSDSDYDEDRKKIIDFIDNGEDVSYESIILYSLEIGMKRSGEK